MLTTPLLAALVWMTAVHHDGSLVALVQAASLGLIAREWPRPSLVAAEIIVIFALLEAVLLVVIPGKKHLGPVTPAGNRPEYKLNGVAAWVATHVLLYVACYRLHWFSPGVVYDNFGSILTTLTLSALAFCLFLYFKGSYFPSSSDSGRSGNVIWDFYWGVELHPSVLGYSLKQYINCRLGMMSWSVIILAFLAKQQELNGHVATSMWVSVAIQLAYIVKFFYWESGYFGSLDIMHDRFGYYICWGVLCWIPSVYTLVGLYLVNHPIELSAPYAALCVVLGLGSIWANYDADAQRQRVRETSGACTVWGKKPELIVARYRTGDGEERQNLLLASGWWGLARHFHYVPEITLSLAWTLPAGATHALPYFYVVYLTILLLDRAGRDELRCAAKYGDDWKVYRERVRARVVPLVY
jgi:7-dehydrocholesterol reductase